jgi:hypothetical protein
MKTAVFHAPSGGLWIACESARAQHVVATLDRHGFSLVEASPGDAASAAVPQAAAIDALRARIRAALDPHEVFAGVR